MNKKNRKFSGKSQMPQGRKQFARPAARPKQVSLEDITPSETGKGFIVEGIVDSVAQTAGPTLFTIVDGTATLVLKGFESPGERAYPEIVEGSAVSAVVKVNEFNGMLEGEIKKIDVLDQSEQKQLLEKIEET